MSIFDGKDMELESVQDIGNTVICDRCNTDYTESDETGGLIIGSWAYCPKCVKEIHSQLSERDLERALCAPAWVPFRQFVLDARGGDNTIKTYVEKPKT